jgi:peptide chain release factor 1
MGESGGGGGIGQIIGGHVHGLHRGNRTNTGGGNTLLQETHISGQSGLVTDSRRNTSKKGRHLRTGLGETENIVDEKKHILSLLVTEIFGNGKSGKGHTGTSSRGLVHLTIHKGGLRTSDGSTLLIDLDDSSLNHLVVKIISLTGALSDTGEHRVTTVVHGNIVNKFHDNDSLSYTGTSEKSDLTTLGVRSQQVNNLNTSHKNLLGLTLLSEERGRAMDGSLKASSDGTLLIHGLTNHIQDTAKSAGSDGNHDGGASVIHSLATHQTLSGFHGNGTDGVLTQMLGDLEDEAGSTLSNLNLQGVKDRGKGTIELDIDNGTDNLGDNTRLHGSRARDASLCDLKSHVRQILQHDVNNGCEINEWRAKQ